MIKYAKIINQETKQCEVGIGTNTAFYESVGMTQMDVEQAYTGDWYVSGYAPQEPAPTHDEQSEKRARAYQVEVDPITSHIQRLRDDDPDDPEIAELIAERTERVAEIKTRFPYPEEPKEE